MTPREENVIFIGNKPVMSYVLAAITQADEGSDDIILKARGRAISRAVDVAELARRRFLQEFDVEDIETGTEEIEKEEGGTSSVSTISITLTRKE